MATSQSAAFVVRVNSYYVLEYLCSEHGQVQLLRHVSGSTGQTELLKEHVSSLHIPLPDLVTQNAAVEPDA